LSARDAEIVHYLRRILGKFSRVEGIRAYPTFDDHLLLTVNLTESEKQVSLPRAAAVLRLKALDAPVAVNFDRGTSSEYMVIEPATWRLVPRATEVIYARVLQGYGSGRLVIEGLSVA